MSRILLLSEDTFLQCQKHQKVNTRDQCKAGQEGHQRTEWDKLHISGLHFHCRSNLIFESSLKMFKCKLII